MKLFFAKGFLENGESLDYDGYAEDMIGFLIHVLETIPGYQVEVCVELAEVDMEEDDYLNSPNTDIA